MFVAQKFDIDSFSEQRFTEEKDELDCSFPSNANRIINRLGGG